MRMLIICILLIGLLNNCEFQERPETITVNEQPREVKASAQGTFSAEVVCDYIGNAHYKFPSGASNAKTYYSYTPVLMNNVHGAHAVRCEDIKGN